MSEYGPGAKRKVKKEFGINLEVEVQFVGFDKKIGH